MKTQTVITILTATLLQHGYATLLVNETFLTGGAPNYTVDTTVTGTNPTSTGFTGSWNTPQVDGTVDFRARSGSLTYSNGQSLVVSGGALEHFRVSGVPIASKDLNRDLNYTMPQSSELWGSFLFSYSSGAEFTLSLTDTVNSRPFEFDLTANVLTAAPAGNSADDLSSGTLSADTTYMVLFKAVDDTGSVYDDYSLWINPVVTQTEGSLGTAAGTGIGIIRELSASNGTSVGYNGFRLESTLTAGQSFTIDEVKLGTSLNDVIVIPEPNTLALLGLALGSLLIFRRRK